MAANRENGQSNLIREEFEGFQRTTALAGTCHGFRLREEALAIKIGGLHVGHVVQNVDCRSL